MEPRTAVVLAGGLGTRLAAITDGRTAKAMVPVLGRPFIDHKLDSLRRLGVAEVVMLVGAGADQIVNHVGDGAGVGQRVRYVHDGPTLLGTGGSIRAALDSLPQRFWVTYADSLVTVDLDAAEAAMTATGARGLMTVLENSDRWDPSNVDVADGLVTAYRKGAAPGTFRWIDYGLLHFERSAFTDLEPGSAADLTTVIQSLVGAGALAAFPVHERFWEIGTPDGLRATEEHLASASGAAGDHGA